MNAQEMHKRFKLAQVKREIEKTAKESKIQKDRQTYVSQATNQLLLNMSERLEFPFNAYVGQFTWIKEGSI